VNIHTVFKMAKHICFIKKLKKYYILKWREYYYYEWSSTKKDQRLNVRASLVAYARQPCQHACFSGRPQTQPLVWVSLPIPASPIGAHYANFNFIHHNMDMNRPKHHWREREAGEGGGKWLGRWQVEPSRLCPTWLVYRHLETDPYRLGLAQGC
jgi:hypothetical protein